MHSSIENIFQVNQLEVVEWILNQDKIFNARTLSVIKSEDQIKWNNDQIWSDLSLLKKHLSKQKKPIILLIRGKGVLDKVVPKDNLDENTLVQEIIPSGLVDDYYVNGFSINGETFGSIARKNIIDNVLTELSELAIIEVFIGSQFLTILPNTIFNESASIQTGNYNLQKQTNGNHHLIQSENFYPSNIISQGAEEINTDHLFCLSLGIIELFNLYNKNSIDLEFTKENKSDNTFRVLTQKLTGPIIIVIFTILLANFLLLNKLEGRYEILITNYELNKEQAEMVKVLEKEITEREVLLKRSGWTNSIKIAKILDQIGESTTKRIVLEELELQPLKDVIKENNRVDFSLNTLNLIGKVENSSSLNDWIKNLNKLDNISDVIMDEYFVERGEEWATFKLKITIN